MDSMGAMHQWLTLAEKKYGITDHDDAQTFTDNGRELSSLAKAIRELTLNDEDRVKCAGWPQAHHPWKTEGATKLDLLTEIEKGLRKYSARCKQHLTKLGYYCHHCQHGLCTVCNDIEGRTQCPRCQTSFPHMAWVHLQPAPPCLNLHALGEQWI